VFKDIIEKGAAELGVSVSAAAVEKLHKYWQAVEEKNKVMNLTAITDEDEAARLHFLDCLGLLKVCDIKGMVIDVGTGGGFPGAPLAAVLENAQFSLMDSTEKKINFVEAACRGAGIDAECFSGRAEELSRNGLFRENFDAAVSRAVARLNILAELCLPFVAVGGQFIAMKSADSDEEIAEAANAIKLLGGAPAEIREYTVPGTDIVRRAVVVKKIAPTPDKYPRSWGKIKKQPL